MSSEVKLEEIINFLEEQRYEYSFVGDTKDVIKGFSTLFNYKDYSLTFVSSLNKFEDYENEFKNRNIKLIITSPKENIFPCFRNVIQIENPKSVFFLILENFFGKGINQQEITVTNDEEVYNKRSFVSKQACVGENVEIGIGCIIEEDVIIGSNTVIHHNVVIKRGTKIGENCTILSGVVIGETGFNPLKEPDGSRNIINHFGGVTIGNDVHIGDNCSISKGSIDDTIISQGVKLNKQVIVAHNVFVGEHTVFTAPTFVGGSVIIGKQCHIAASVIRNQCTIQDQAILGLGSVVVKDVAKGTTVVGNPARLLEK